MENHKVCFFSSLIFFLSSFLIPAAYATQDKFPGEFDLRDVSSVEEAVAIVSDKLTKMRFDIVLTVDHAAGAAGVGLELRPTQVIFARPKRSLERKLVNRSATLGIDLPQKFLVFEDENGAIQLRYNPTGYLADRHDIKILDSTLRQIAKTNRLFGDNEDGLITIESNNSVDDTVLALQTAILAADPAFRIPLILEYDDHDGHRKGSVLLVFGNPNAGTPLMQTTQEVAIDLPQKFLVWSNNEDQVFITYNDPVFIGKRHNVQGQDDRLQAIANALRNFAKAGAGISE